MNIETIIPKVNLAPSLPPLVRAPFLGPILDIAPKPINLLPKPFDLHLPGLNPFESMPLGRPMIFNEGPMPTPIFGRSINSLDALNNAPILWRAPRVERIEQVPVPNVDRVLGKFLNTKPLIEKVRNTDQSLRIQNAKALSKVEPSIFFPSVDPLVDVLQRIFKNSFKETSPQRPVERFNNQKNQLTDVKNEPKHSLDSQENKLKVELTQAQKTLEAMQVANIPQEQIVQMLRPALKEKGLILVQTDGAGRGGLRIAVGVGEETSPEKIKQPKFVIAEEILSRRYSEALRATQNAFERSQGLGIAGYDIADKMVRFNSYLASPINKRDDPTYDLARKTIGQSMRIYWDFEKAKLAVTHAIYRFLPIKISFDEGDEISKEEAKLVLQGGKKEWNASLLRRGLNELRRWNLRYLKENDPTMFQVVRTIDNIP